MRLGTQRQSQDAAISRKLMFAIGTPLLLVLLAVGWWAYSLHQYNLNRVNWKARTLPQLAGLTLTNEPIREDLSWLGKDSDDSGVRRWAGARIILMTNGEWLIYGFWHGANNGVVDHLFLSHGSDGRWFYSTYHFCSSMVGVMGEDQPGSINEFTNRYAVREFDGKSDVCLQHTWP